jgi:hypothetical protein
MVKTFGEEAWLVEEILVLHDKESAICAKAVASRRRE